MLPEWQGGTPESKRFYVVIDVQSTVQLSMPFRGLEHGAMGYRHLRRGLEPVPRIQTIVLYTGERA